MDVRLRIHTKNLYPIRGFLIKGGEPFYWLRAIQDIGMCLEDIDVYPLGGRAANSTWGCMVVSQYDIDRAEVQKYDLCQKVNDWLYIPEMSKVSPHIQKDEAQRLFQSEVHLFHPEVGLVSLGEPIKWEELILISSEKMLDVTIPGTSIFIPRKITTFFIQPVPKDEILKDLETPVQPKKIEEKPLTLAEKARLKFYEALLSGDLKNGKKGRSGGLGGGALGGLGGGQGSGLGGFLGGIFGGLGGALVGGLGDMMSGLEGMTDSMRQDMEELQKRNKNQLEKLMDMFENNPEEAMKYAIPLDGEGTSRGDFGEFNMTRRWDDFSLFGSGRSTGTGGGGVSLGDDFFKLRQQYYKTAEALANDKKYEKAAFIYMKLLKDYAKAAQTLEKGKLYQEAAAIYLKYVKDKLKAAECYEKGLFYQEAVELYVEIKKHEKAGDLLMKMNKREVAYEQYTLLANEYISKQQYVKASLVYRNKMDDRESAQEALLKGWNEDRDALNCLHNYFSNISDDREVLKSISELIGNSLRKTNIRSFLKVLGAEFKKREDINKSIKENGYELISEWSLVVPNTVYDLKLFDLDPEIKMDADRYTIAQRAKQVKLERITKSMRG